MSESFSGKYSKNVTVEYNGRPHINKTFHKVLCNYLGQEYDDNLSAYPNVLTTSNAIIHDAHPDAPEIHNLNDAFDVLFKLIGFIPDEEDEEPVDLDSK